MEKWRLEFVGVDAPLCGVGGKEGNTVVISEESLDEREGDACTDVIDSEEEEIFSVLKYLLEYKT